MMTNNMGTKMVSAALSLILCALLVASVPMATAAKETTKHAKHHPIFEEHFKNGAHNPEFDHLAILGSKKIEEEFDELEPEESKIRLARLIPKMDLDKDGRLVMPELQSWVFNSYKSLDKEEALEELKNMDVNEDGSVSWEEYIQKIYSYTPQELAEIRAKEGAEIKEIEKMISDDEEKFKTADRNQDKLLDANEFPALLHPHDYEFMHNGEIKRALDEHDKNHDGKIDLEEYRSDSEMTRSDETEKLAEKVKFDEYDTDKDGFLNTEEMKAWIIPTTMENAREEAEHLISEADTNKDDMLSMDEILENYDTFVGSQATDYGRHLHLVHEDL